MSVVHVHVVKISRISENDMPQKLRTIGFCVCIHYLFDLALFACSLCLLSHPLFRGCPATQQHYHVVVTGHSLGAVSGLQLSI